MDDFSSSSFSGVSALSDEVGDGFMGAPMGVIMFLIAVQVVMGAFFKQTKSYQNETRP